MLPTKKYAEVLLVEAEGMNPGPWGDHSRMVAKCAGLIAQKCGLDVEKAYIVGLLHDIGRRFGVTQMAHIIDGYHFMTEQGFDEVAKICITHSFAVPDMAMECGKPDVTPEDYALIDRLIHTYQYDDYDRLIQVCDSIAFSDRVVDMKLRMDDVERRYGRYPQEKRQKHYELKQYFEEKMGCNLYKAVEADKELWGR